MIVRVEGCLGLSTVCKGCGLREHYYSNCYYLCPERTPSGFNPPRELQAYAKVVLQDNTILAGEIQRMRLQYRKKSKTFYVPPLRKRNQNQDPKIPQMLIDN